MAQSFVSSQIRAGVLEYMAQVERNHTDLHFVDIAGQTIFPTYDPQGGISSKAMVYLYWKGWGPTPEMFNGGDLGRGQQFKALGGGWYYASVEWLADLDLSQKGAENRIEAIRREIRNHVANMAVLRVIERGEVGKLELAMLWAAYYVRRLQRKVAAFRAA